MSSRARRPISAAALCCAGGLLLGSSLSCGGGGATGPETAAIIAIVVAPDSTSLTAGSSQAFAAQAQTAAATPVPNATFFWSTSDSLVAMVSQRGVVTARIPGTAKISASAQGQSGYARVIVVQPVVRTVRVAPAVDTIYATHPGDTARLAATALDSAGNPIANRPLVWTVSGTMAAVNAGVVTATNTAAGKVTVTATSADTAYAAGTAAVTVIGHVATATLTPSFAWLSTTGSFFLSRTVQLAAALKDTFGNDVSGQRRLTWKSSNPSVATVNGTGLVTAVSTTNGNTQITATTPDGTSASATITVFP